MCESGTKIMAAGLVDEGIRFEEMVKEIAELKAKIASGKPVCPYCQKIMKTVNYNGYYDSFSYWACNCENFPEGEQAHGMYA